MTYDNTQAMMAYDARKKSIALAYVLWFFLGGLGAHNFYLGRNGVAITQLVLMILGVLTAVLLVGLFLMAGVGIWVLIDAFIIPGTVERSNMALAAQFKSNASATPPARFTAHDLSAEMDALATLRNSGAITEAEYEEKRQALLARLQ